MELIKLVDYEGISHYLNKRYIISIRPFDSLGHDNRRSKVEYGNGWTDCIYMKELVHEVACVIQGVYFRKEIQ